MEGVNRSDMNEGEGGQKREGCVSIYLQDDYVSCSGKVGERLMTLLLNHILRRKAIDTDTHNIYRVLRL